MMVPMPDDSGTREHAAGPVHPGRPGADPRTHPLGTGAAGPSRRRGRALVAAALLAAAFNLRPAVASIGPVLAEIRHGLGMSGTVAGLLTSLPMLCFGLFGALAPRPARRFGPTPVVLAGLLALTAGLALRPWAGRTPVFLAASALALAGIAVGNVLMPVVVKRHFPDRVGTMTGLYSTGIAAGTSLAAAVTVPLDHALGGDWRPALAAWAAPAALALPLWLLVAGARRAAGTGSRSAPAPPAPPRAAPPGRAAAPARPARRIGASRTAWAMAVFFGLQATGAYVTIGWLPQVYRDAGIPASTAGLLLALTMAIGVPLSFALPSVAGRLRHQGGLAVCLALFGLAGYAGLWLAPATLPWLWAALLGLANSAFPLALTMIGMRARSAAGVVRLSAFSQCTGYLLSIPGPILVGALYQHTGGWGAPIALMAALLVPQSAAGYLAGRDRHVEDEV